MSLTQKGEPYEIPEYSLTGDLLSYLTCGLQYRYHSRGALPPATPVQLWFGEFIHGVMEEAFHRWKHDKAYQKFAWDWPTQVREIELEINKRLISRGMVAPPKLFCPFEVGYEKTGACPDLAHPHQQLSSLRTAAMINTWGPALFPLIENAEIKLTGIRPMPNHQAKVSRSNYYGVRGIADVISSVNLNEVSGDNLMLMHLNDLINEIEEDEFEIIVDYKGMRRPPQDSLTWQHHEWQLHTYSWLYQQQAQAKKVVAGILFYINELEPSLEDMKLLKAEVDNQRTDKMPGKKDLKSLNNWNATKKSRPQLTPIYHTQRSIRVINMLDDNQTQAALTSFDEVVEQIEQAVLNEKQGTAVTQCWEARPEEKTCTACDFKTFCPAVKGKYSPSVP